MKGNRPGVKRGNRVEHEQSTGGLCVCGEGGGGGVENQTLLFV